MKHPSHDGQCRDHIYPKARRWTIAILALTGLFLPGAGTASAQRAKGILGTPVPTPAPEATLPPLAPSSGDKTNRDNAAYYEHLEKLERELREMRQAGPPATAPVSAL